MSDIRAVLVLGAGYEVCPLCFEYYYRESMWVCVWCDVSLCTNCIALEEGEAVCLACHAIPENER